MQLREEFFLFQVLLGGLDTLEVIGRKAMNVIQEGDPGLRKKRAFLANRKPNLSLVIIPFAGKPQTTPWFTFTYI